MSEDQTLPSDRFSIVVMGAMNPRLHHPIWYNLHKFLTDEEAKQALAGPMLCLPQMAQFQTSQFQITCVENRWDIATNNTELRQRLIEITSGVFDERLRETPVNLFAFNHDFYRKVEGADINVILGRTTTTKALRLSLNGVTSGSGGFTLAGADGSVTNVRYEPSVRAGDEVFVGINANHPVHATKPGYFDLKVLMQKTFDPDFEAAKRIANDIATALLRRED